MSKETERRIRNELNEKDLKIDRERYEIEVEKHWAGIFSMMADEIYQNRAKDLNKYRMGSDFKENLGIDFVETGEMIRRDPQKIGLQEESIKYVPGVMNVWGKKFKSGKIKPDYIDLDGKERKNRNEKSLKEDESPSAKIENKINELEGQIYELKAEKERNEEYDKDCKIYGVYTNGEAIGIEDKIDNLKKEIEILKEDLAGYKRTLEETIATKEKQIKEDKAQKEKARNMKYDFDKDAGINKELWKKGIEDWEGAYDKSILTNKLKIIEEGVNYEIGKLDKSYEIYEKEKRIETYENILKERRELEQERKLKSDEMENKLEKLIIKKLVKKLK